VLSFISSNKFFRAAYGEKLRKHLADNCSIRSIIDFGELPVFESAATFPMVFVAQLLKPSVKHLTKFAQIKSLDAPYPDMAALVRQRGQLLPTDAIESEKWTLVNASSANLLRKMERTGIPLGEYVKNQIYYGIKTGFNTAFVIDSAKRAELIAQDPKSKEIIKRLAVGDDVRRWHIDLQDRWLIFSRKGIDIKKYPAIEKHLAKFKKELMPGGDGGRKPGSYEWYEIQDNVAYWKEFEKPKIIYPQIMMESRFTFDTDGIFTNQKCFIIVVQDLFLLALLNSAPVWEFLKQISVSFGDPENGGRLEPRKDDIMRIPIPAASAAEQEALSGLVDGILAAKRTGDAATVKELESEIDTHVFRLYALTPAEIHLVKGTAK
jgi:TaqI-like C-terminal specificity domain